MDGNFKIKTLVSCQEFELHDFANASAYVDSCGVFFANLFVEIKAKERGNFDFVRIGEG